MTALKARTIRRLAGSGVLGLIWVSMASAQPAKPIDKKATPAPAAKPAPPPKPKSPCPEAAYQTACDSYAELVKAKDEIATIAVRQGDVAFVCFRREEDSFFILHLPGPLWSRHFDAEQKRIVIDDDAKSRRLGTVSEFSNGIHQSGTMPIYSFRGDWQNPPDPFLLAEMINFRNVDEFSSLEVMSSTVTASSRYKNKLDKSVDYQLIIQRSTGRFIERYTNEKEQIAFLEHQGRCAVPPTSSQ